MDLTEIQKIRDALERAERTVSLRPERGQRVYRNTARLVRGTRCEVSEADTRLVIDVGRSVGGDGDAPDPSVILRSALSSCVAIGVKQAAARRGVNIAAISVTVETSVDARGQLGVRSDIVPGFERIKIEIDIVSAAPESDIEDLVARSLRISPLMDAFERPHSIDHELHLTRSETE